MKPKRYFVLMRTEKFIFEKKTNSFKVAKWLADLKIWKYAKIHDAFASDVNPPWSKCIYIKENRS